MLIRTITAIVVVLSLWLLLSKPSQGVDYLSGISTPTVKPACTGDCNNDGQVRIQEVILSINLAMGKQPTECCPNADGNRDGRVTISEVQQVIRNATKGCK